MTAIKRSMMAAAGSAGESKLYVEDVFSTYLYSGTNATQIITNGVDMTEGGLVWCKPREVSENNILVDSEYSSTNSYQNYLISNTNGPGATGPAINSFNSTGFTLNSNWYANDSSAAYGGDYVSWSFRKAEKFFDVVTWTGSNNSATDIGKGIVPHNLGVAPALVIVKNATQSSTNWVVYHKDQSTGYYSLLNSSAAQTNSGSVSYFSKHDGGWSQTNPDANNIYVGYNSQTNGNTNTMVAYLFASDAGGFGDDGNENIIKCGIFTGTASTLASVNLGFEPQFIIIKATNSGDNWRTYDDMRGWSTATRELLNPNTNAAGSAISNTSGYDLIPTATGFDHKGHDGSNPDTQYIYIAVRRPMKTPSAGTEVYKPDTYSGNDSTTATLGSGIVCAGNVLTMIKAVNNSTEHVWVDVLRGSGRYLQPNGTNAEIDNSAYWAYDFKMDGWTINASGSAVNNVSRNYVAHTFKRASGFMDMVAYKGTGVAHTEAHNLGVAPELIIVKPRSNANGWSVYSKDIGITQYLQLHSTSAAGTYSLWNNTAPTATDFSVETYIYVNGSSETYIAYLFATLAGVSKVGSYTGTGADLNVDCGFSAGARFILIKRTDSTGDWYYWDSARGIVAGNDPYLLLNSTAAEVANTDYIDPLSSGFTVTSSAPAALNASGGSYIFLAIA